MPHSGQNFAESLFSEPQVQNQVPEEGLAGSGAIGFGSVGAGAVPPIIPIIPIPTNPVKAPTGEKIS